MIMAECHLAAYKDAGFPVAAIASRTKANAEKVAKRWGIPKVYGSPQDLIRDDGIEILDIAFPPDQQPALIACAAAEAHQGDPRAEAAGARRQERPPAGWRRPRRGKPLSVNQNMRFDQSMRVLKQILDLLLGSATSSSPRSRCGRSRTGSPSSPTTTG